MAFWGWTVDKFLLSCLLRLTMWPSHNYLTPSSHPHSRTDSRPWRWSLAGHSCSFVLFKCFFFFFKDFLMWASFKSLYWICCNIASVLYFGFLDHEACGILASQPWIKPAPPALESEVLTTGPPGDVLGHPCLKQLWESGNPAILLK